MAPTVIRVLAGGPPATTPLQTVMTIQDSGVGQPGPQGEKGEKGPPGEPSTFTVNDYPAGQALGGNRVVMLAADGELYYADQTNPAHFNRVLGVTAGAVAEGERPLVRCAGIMEEPSWAWELDKFIYLSASGLMTQAPPASGFLLVIGWPVTAASMLIDIKEPILIL